MKNVKLGPRRAFIGFGVFVVVFAALLALKRLGMPDYFGLAWWAVVLGASAYLVWRGWKARNNPDGMKGPGGWGAVMPRALSRWVLGEDDSDRR